MKKIFLMLIFYSVLYAQDVVKVGDEVSGTRVTQGFIMESISGSGFTRSIYNHVANLAGSNPAALYTGENVSMGISYQWEPVVDPLWITDLNHQRGHWYLPQSVGIDYPLKSFRVGLGFSQRYNSVLGMDAMEITTEYQPEGTGEFFTAESNNLISCYSLQFSRAMDNLIMTGDQFCIGIRFNYNRVDFVDRIYHTEAKASGGALGGALGLRYGFSDNVQVGIFYERNPYFKEKFEIEGTDLVIEHDPLIGGNNPVINAKFDNKFFLKDKLPDRLTMGFLYRVNEKLEMTLEAAGIYWHQWDDRAVNSVEISGGLLGHITRHFSLSMSLLSTDRKYKDNTASYIYESQEALFLLAGVNVHLESVDFDVALAKTVAYDKWRKQSIAKFSLGYHL